MIPLSLKRKQLLSEAYESAYLDMIYEKHITQLNSDPVIRGEDHTPSDFERRSVVSKGLQYELEAASGKFREANGKNTFEQFAADYFPENFEELVELETEEVLIGHRSGGEPVFENCGYISVAHTSEGLKGINVLPAEGKQDYNIWIQQLNY